MKRLTGAIVIVGMMFLSSATVSGADSVAEFRNLIP